MKLFRYPTEADVREIIARPTKDAQDLAATVAAVLRRVKEEGDQAVMDYERMFDHVELTTLAVTEAEFAAAEAQVSSALKAALELAHGNIARFHASQRYAGIEVETAPGVHCWQRSVPIERVGLYVPGGTAPLFSTVLMLATPARIAGCKEVVLCTPPQRDGSVNPAILVAARIAGVSRVFKAGGVQAIGAMAYGTESVPKVSKIFGPGNQYVQAAKQQVSQVLLVTTSETLLTDVQAEVERQLQALPRKEIAAAALENSRLVLVRSTAEAMALTNRYAPEHLILETADADALAAEVVNAGSVFIGHLTPESAGDYASGTNHTLPTNGYATAYSGVNLDAFCRKITYQQITPEGLRAIGRAVELMAEAEQLDAHKNAMTLRLKSVL